MLGFRTKAHHALHAGTVVPRAVEEDDLSASWEVLDVALEVPRGGLTWGRLFQGDDARTTGVEVLVEALDGATLTGGIATLEENDVALAGFLGPVLPLQQLDLQGALGLLILFAAHALVVWVLIAPGIHAVTIRGDEYGIIFIGIVDQVALGGGEIYIVEIVLVLISHGGAP